MTAATTNIIDDHYLTAELPSLTDNEILEHYKQLSNGNNSYYGKTMYTVPLFSPTGSKLSHRDVLSILDQFVNNNEEGDSSSNQTLLLIFIRPPNTQMGHFILAAEKPDFEKHYIWWDSLNLSNSVLEDHFKIPATEMFSGGSLFERGFSQWKSNEVMAEARWATCGYWCLVWAHMLNTVQLEDEEKELRVALSHPIPRDGGAFTIQNLKNPQVISQNSNPGSMLKKLIALNTLMLQYYGAI